MIDLIYIEDSVREHERAKEIMARFPKASVVPCNHYKEIFNPRGQNFRLQKKKPALILARQTGKLIHPIPPSYGVGGTTNYYFSHLLNCLYDCRYCFLQGMYPSAHYVHFVNYEDFQQSIDQTLKQAKEPVWFFSGYDCDSLALESVTGFARAYLPFFNKRPDAWIELRTKSTNIEVLENTSPFPNAVVAFSFTPEEVSRQTEAKVPPLASRIKAMHKLAELGWKVGWRIDPVIDSKNFKQRYSTLFDNLLKGLSPNMLHSVSLGAFRMPSGFFKRVEKLYPQEHLLAGQLVKTGGMVSYRQDIEQDRLGICKDLLRARIPEEKLFFCESPVV